MTRPKLRIVEQFSASQHPPRCYVVIDEQGRAVRDRDGEHLWATKASARAVIRELGGREAKSK